MCLEAPNSWIERYFFCQHIVLGIQSYSQMVIRVSNHLRNAIVFRFHYHSQKVIGSLGLFFTKTSVMGWKLFKYYLLELYLEVWKLNDWNV